jgi:hypothetical protein
MIPSDVSQRADPYDALSRCLHDLSDFVILRNEHDLFGNLQRGGDVDLLVGDLPTAERVLIDHLGVPVRITRRSSVTGYSYDWGHIDLLQALEWRGACYLSTRTVLQQRRLSANGRPIPSPAHEALVAWLTSLLWGGFFKERYTSIIGLAARRDGDEFRRGLTDAVGNKWGLRLWRAASDGTPEISAGWARALRRAAWRRACVRSPMSTIRRFLAFVVAELRLRLHPSTPLVALVGADEQETSALTTAVQQRFAACPYVSARVFRWPPQGRSPEGLALVLAARWLFAYWTHLVNLRAKGYLVVVALCGRRPLALGPLRPRPDLVFSTHASSRAKPASDSRAASQALDGMRAADDMAADVQRRVRTWMHNGSRAKIAFAHAAASHRHDRGVR